MQEDHTFQSECGVFVVLPEQGNSSEFPPLAVTVTGKQPESSAEVGCPTPPPLSCISSSPVSTSSGGRSPGHDAFDANIVEQLEAYQTKLTTPPNVPVSRKQKVKAWRDAILRKRELVLECLQAQKIIEKVENEAAQYLTRETIARFHQKCYNLDGGNTCEGMFISAVSALKIGAE